MILCVFCRTKNFSLNEYFATENSISFLPRTGTSCPAANLTLLTSEGGDSWVCDPFGFGSP